MMIARRLKAQREVGGAVQLEGTEVKVELNEEQEIENLVPKQVGVIRTSPSLINLSYSTLYVCSFCNLSIYILSFQFLLYHKINHRHTFDLLIFPLSYLPVNSDVFVFCSCYFYSLLICFGLKIDLSPGGNMN